MTLVSFGVSQTGIVIRETSAQLDDTSTIAFDTATGARRWALTSDQGVIVNWCTDGKATGQALDESPIECDIKTGPA